MMGNARRVFTVITTKLIRTHSQIGKKKKKNTNFKNILTNNYYLLYNLIIIIIRETCVKWVARISDRADVDAVKTDTVPRGKGNRP